MATQINTTEIYKEKIENSFKSISGINNTVPNVMKRTFNFKGRKSPEIAAIILRDIAPKNAIICDPFVGGNSFGLAAVKNGFRFIGSELDNYTWSAVNALFCKYDESKFYSLFKKVSSECEQAIMNLYSTKCCNKNNYIKKLHFDPEGKDGFENPEYYHPKPHRDINNNRTVQLVNRCPVCNETAKCFEYFDEKQIKKCNSLNTNKFPRHHLIENSRINITVTHNADCYDRNFTKRAMYSLLLIQNSINKLPNCIEKDILEHCLVASLTLSRICQYGSGSEYIYQVMRQQAQEANVWLVFKDKVTNFSTFKNTYKNYQYDDISSPASKMYIVNGDYKSLLSRYEETFDIIYTDPPYTDQVAFLERSQLYRDWLHSFYDKNNHFVLTKNMLDNEIVVTNAPSRLNKSIEKYYHDIDIMFNYFYNSLKPNGLVVLTVKLGSRKYLTTLAEYIKLAKKNGLEFIIKYCIDKNDPTIRKQAARKNTMANEMLLFFRKLSSEELHWFHDNIDMEFEVIKIAYNSIKDSREGSITLTECVTQIETHLRSSFNILPSSTIHSKITSILKKNFYITEKSYVYIDPNKLYLELEDSRDLFIKLYDTIPIIIRNFDVKEGFTLEDLYFEIINHLFEGNNNILNQIIDDSTHEAQIKTLLENYCNMDDNERYYYKRLDTVHSKTAQDISSMDGYEFEKLITRLLEQKGFKDVVRVGGASDRGIDIIATKIINGKKEGFIFQCKRWLANVGGTPIQRLHSMMIQMQPKVSHAICITTSNYTRDAKRESRNTGVKIINGHELMEELNRLFPNEFFHAALDISPNV